MADKVDASVVAARARLMNHFSQPAHLGDKQADGWAKLWDQGDFLPWDKGFPNPALVDLLRERQDLIGASTEEAEGKIVRRKKALVPGCGRGIDVLLLQSFGYDAVGLEYSQTAVDACKQHEKEHGKDYPVISEKVGKGFAKFVVGDFFKPDWMKDAGMAEEDKFDFIYDYTFFCALPPSLRPAWALRMSQLLGPSPDANLVCLEFPTYKPLSSGGPPFGSPSATYMKHLSRPGEEVTYDDSPVEANKEGLVRVDHWKPARTHEVGKDENGNVRDFVAVWRHR